MATRRAKQPPPTVVLFVRHARTPTTGSVLPGRAPGLHLADGGRADADKMAERLASTAKIEAVYASPLERARETAEPIARRLGRKVAIERGLVECDFGDWTGAELKSLRKLPEWRGVQSWPSGFRFPSGESFPEMQCRVTAAVARLRVRHPGATIVAVSHADPIKAVVADALGTHLDLFQRIVISPCSVTAVAYGETGPLVLGVNATDGLDEVQPS
jgi:probable phosphomutase (TIGR03848 family)